MAATQNVLILSSNTGGGHRSAAYALENSFNTIDPGRVLVKIAQVLEDSSWISRSFADLYNYLLRHRQDLMQHYFWFIENFKPNESKLVIKSALRYGLQMVERYTPDVIVSVHPMTQHLFGYVLKRLGLLGRIPLITVVTDPCSGFWRGWACDDVQQYYVASDEARQQLIRYNVDPTRIHVAGMPIHSRFQPPTEEDRLMARELFGLDPNKFTLFLNAGWIGGGNIPRIAESLASSDLDIQAVFLAGTNEKLLSHGHKLAQNASFPVKVVGYTNEIHRLMQASDLMVSKLGGLTTFEALATQLPILADVTTRPMPQEAQTTRFLEHSGAGLLLHNPDEVVTVVRSLLDSPNLCDMMRQSARQYGHPGAADHIAQDILQTIRS